MLVSLARRVADDSPTKDNVADAFHAVLAHYAGDPIGGLPVESLTKHMTTSYAR